MWVSNCVYLMVSVTVAVFMQVHADPCLGLEGIQKKYRSGNHCWFMLPKDEDWRSAQEKCREHESNLPIIHNADINREYRGAFRNLTSIITSSWIGGNITLLPWTWVSGTPLYTRLGCCEVENISECRSDRLNSASRCVPHCLQKGYTFAYLKEVKCGCSSVSCNTFHLDEDCGGRCPGNYLTEHCGSHLLDYYTGYNTTEGAIPHWKDNHREGDSPCAAIHVLKSGNKTRTELRALSCGHALPFICQPDGLGHYTVQDKMAWMNARYHCYQNDSFLATVRTDSEILEKLSDGSCYWIGLSRFEARWLTGEDMIYHSFDMFQTSFIDACLVSNRDQDYWTTDDCTKKKSFLCIKEPGASSSTNATTELPGDSSTQTWTTVAQNWTNASTAPNDSPEGFADEQIMGLAIGMFGSVFCLTAIGLIIHARNRRMSHAHDVNTASIALAGIRETSSRQSKYTTLTEDDAVVQPKKII